MVHLASTGKAPAYVSELLQSATARTTRTGLRSASIGVFIIPRLRTVFGERAFSVAGPAAWNSLPVELRLDVCTEYFKRRLKTHLFNLAFI